jgi:hypothetical protein
MAKQQTAAAPARRGNIPILKLALGVVLVLFFLLALMLQIQTSEAFILNGKAVGLSANWAVLKQPFALAQGTLTLDMAKAVMWGWGIELIYLVCVVGEVAIQGRLSGLFKTGAVVLVLFDFWTDMQYGTMASGIGGQIAFAAVTSFIVAFFGYVGLELIFHSLDDVCQMRSGCWI